MLSFDVSVIDVVLVIAVTILMLLFLSPKRPQPTEKSDSPSKGRKEFPDKPKVSRKNAQEELSTTQPSTD